MISSSGWVAYLCIQSLLSIIGCAANLVVIIIVRTRKQLHTRTNYFLVNLAVADLFTLLLDIATDITVDVIIEPWENNNCSKPGDDELIDDSMKVVYQLYSLSFLFKAVSNLTLMCLAIGRYNALVRTYESLASILQRKSTLALVWCVPVFTFIVKIIVIKVAFSSNLRSLFRVEYLMEISYWLFFLIIPVLVIVYCYGCVIKGICSDKTILGEGVVDGPHWHRVNIKVVSRLVIVTTISLVSSIPTLAEIIYFSFNYECMPGFVILLLVQSSVDKLTATLNPIIYSMLNYSFRQEILKLVKKIKAQRVGNAVEDREQENDNQLEI